MGVPYLGPYNVNSTMNPILATCMGLGYYFNSYSGQPVVRRGGAVILYHPLNEGFNQLHHPSYVDFYEEVLAESTDPAVVGEKYEQQFATDPWYIHLYRTSHAYHGVHPFYMWYWAAHAMDHVDEVIWVGGDRRVASRLGFRAATHAGRRAGDGVRHRGQQPVDHLPAQPAPPASRTCRWAAVTEPWPSSRTGSRTSRKVARGWRWGRRPQVPRSAEPWVPPRGPRCSRPTGRAAGPRRWRGRWRRRPGWSRCSAPRCGPASRDSTSSPGSRARCIFVANHASHLDTPLILLSLPDEWRRRTAVAAAADYFFDTWWRAVGSALLFNTFPIDRRGGSLSATPGEVLADGWSLVIFPEGTRSQDGWVGRFRMGAAFLAWSTASPSSPSPTAAPSRRCRAGRAGRAPGRRQLTIRFGEPLRPAEGESPRSFAPRIKDAVAALLDEDRSTWWEARRRAASGADARPVRARTSRSGGGSGRRRSRPIPTPRRRGSPPGAADPGRSPWRWTSTGSCASPSAG